MDEIFKALNDPTRRSILDMLRKKPMTAGQISELFDMSKPSISHHLDILKRAGWVSAEKQGQFVLYTLKPATAKKISKWIGQIADSLPSEKK
jgi:DNA-binding transcriptional ArsR family regulator